MQLKRLRGEREREKKSTYIVVAGLNCATDEKHTKSTYKVASSSSKIAFGLLFLLVVACCVLVIYCFFFFIFCSYLLCVFFFIYSTNRARRVLLTCLWCCSRSQIVNVCAVCLSSIVWRKECICNYISAIHPIYVNKSNVALHSPLKEYPVTWRICCWCCCRCRHCPRYLFIFCSLFITLQNHQIQNPLDTIHVYSINTATKQQQ